MVLLWCGFLEECQSAIALRKKKISVGIKKKYAPVKWRNVHGFCTKDLRVQILPSGSKLFSMFWRVLPSFLFSFQKNAQLSN